MQFIFIIIIFMFGIVIGSFLNVCIYRIPKKESIAKERSHCMSCGYQLKWYDLVPLFSWLFLRGKCRKCKAKISPQYPIVEGLNGLMYVAVYLKYGLTVETVLYSFLISILIVISLIDFRTLEIPQGLNIAIAILGVIGTGFDYTNWLDHLIGVVCVSVPLFVIWFFSGGRAIGGGDIKLMAATGLLLGWKLNVFALACGCILGSVIHLIRMKAFKADKTLAMGPYLSMGITLSVFVGDIFFDWYLGLL